MILIYWRMRMKKIVLWGVGRRTRRYMHSNFFENCEIVALVDTYKNGEKFLGKTIISPNCLIDIIKEIDFVVITSQYFSEIYYECISMGLPKEKIVLTDIVLEKIYNQNIEIIKSLSPQVYKEICINQHKLMYINQKDFVDDKKLIGKGKYATQEYMLEYYRYRTFEFVAEEIEAAHIDGCIAEFGVFRGTFSALMNEKMPEKKLYLFDTFEGFDINEARKEADLGRSDEVFEYAHRQTSIEMVLAAMTYPQQCILCKGLFPNSITKEAESEMYAFVSIDVDFEDSIYEGLKFFYPRLNHGGYIFIHDYNSAYLVGVRKAVLRYELDLGTKLNKVPIADRAGTLVIVK